MLTLLRTTGCDLSVEEKILAMSDETISRTIPDQLRQTGLLSEDEIHYAVLWLQEYRSLHRLDVIE